MKKKKPRNNMFNDAYGRFTQLRANKIGNENSKMKTKHKSRVREKERKNAFF